MKHHRTSAPRVLSAAVTVVLAVTAGALTAPPVFAAADSSVTAPAGTLQDLPLLKDDSRLAGAGPSGFLSWHGGSGMPITYAWTRYADRSIRELPTQVGLLQTAGTDLLTEPVLGAAHTVFDMATGAPPVVLDLSTLGEGFQRGRAVSPSSVFVQRADPAGGESLHVVTKTEEGLKDEVIAGIPAGADITLAGDLATGTALVKYTDPSAAARGGTRLAVVDIARRAVVEEVTPAHPTGSVAVSPTHLAWVEWPTDTTATVVVTRRGSAAAPLRIPLAKAADVQVELVGGWVLYGQAGHDTPYAGRNPLYALTARSLADERSVKVLDAYTRSTAGQDGTLLVQGGTLTGGEGVYRIAPGADGVPTVRQVASTGRPTALTLLSSDVPAVVDFDKQNPATLAWRLSTTNASTTATLTHVATGRTVLLNLHSSAGTKKDTWNGEFDNGIAAHNGTWTWRLTAKPNNGIGPAIDETGTFRVQRAAVPHDFDDNGLPDVLGLSENGTFERHTVVDAATDWHAEYAQSTVLGTGWNVYDRIVPTANLGGAAHADILTRDRAGVLWLHQGNGEKLDHRVRIGGGWQVYDQLTSAADLTGDGRTDLVATDRTGALWLYKGTGKAAAPFGARTRVGGGWNTYDKIAAVGNLAGAPAGDLVARDRAGVLWLYLGKGDGTFAARTRIGGGWQDFTQIIGVGDQDRDGRGDLMAVRGPSPSLYRGTGDWRKPLAARQYMGAYHLPWGIYF
ncbi:VCBS repeat-containing protein [Streptomyces sp. NPDC007818]|uniref:VCBS repeat-containing protein n=1 Tax=Streptomyces sp. NPDC007818 TaxID=3364780 RepID=UPI0036804BC1